LRPRATNVQKAMHGATTVDVDDPELMIEPFFASRK